MDRAQGQGPARTLERDGIMFERQLLRRTRRATILGLAGFVVILWVLAAIWVLNPRLADVGAFFPGNAPVERLTPQRTVAVARSTSAVFRDTQAVWETRFRSEFDRPFEAAQIVFFVDQTPSPCAGAANAAGPFYCEITRSASLDLAFLESLGRFLHRQGDIGAALFVGRVLATHVQSELGTLRAWQAASRTATRTEQRALDLALALEADCLTGVWAHHATERIGKVPEGFYGHVIGTAREVVWARPAGAVLADAALLAPGSREERDAAFNLGRSSGLIGDCAEPPA